MQHPQTRSVKLCQILSEEPQNWKTLVDILFLKKFDFMTEAKLQEILDMPSGVWFKCLLALNHNLQSRHHTQIDIKNDNCL